MAAAIQLAGLTTARFANACQSLLLSLGYTLLWQNGRRQEAFRAFHAGLRYWPWDWRLWKVYLVACCKDDVDSEPAIGSGYGIAKGKGVAIAMRVLYLTYTPYPGRASTRFRQKAGWLTCGPKACNRSSRAATLATFMIGTPSGHTGVLRAAAESS